MVQLSGCLTIRVAFQEEGSFVVGKQSSATLEALP